MDGQIKPVKNCNVVFGAYQLNRQITGHEKLLRILLDGSLH